LKEAHCGRHLRVTQWQCNRMLRMPQMPRADSDPEIPNSRPPDSRFGRETGRESPFPDSAGNRKRRGPRLGLAANREIGDAPAV
jgi:hypothetical protein